MADVISGSLLAETSLYQAYSFSLAHSLGLPRFLACLLWMCLAVSGSGLFVGFLFPVEFFLLPALFGNGFSLACAS